MRKYTTIKLNAGNNPSGNPRRVYVVFNQGSIVATYEEGNRGDSALTNKAHRRGYAGMVFETTVKEYMWLVNRPARIKRNSEKMMKIMMTEEIDLEQWKEGNKIGS